MVAGKVPAADRAQFQRNAELRARDLFRLSGWILQVLPEESDRRCLANRIGEFLCGKRRGSLRLPRRFPEPIRALSKLSKTQVRNIAYWVKPNMSGRVTISNCTASYLARVAPGKIWRCGRGSLPRGLEADVPRLPNKFVPRVSRATWPSTPDLFESLELARRGRVSPGLDKAPLTVKDCLTAGDISDDIRLSSRIVAQQIVGVRFNMKVPENFLRYFRRRYGFLILSVRHSLPAGLVRFLIGLWVKTPTSLWLVENCPFRIFLRRHRRSDFIRKPALDIPIIDRDIPSRVGSPELIAEPEDLWSLYEPRTHYFTECLIKDAIAEQCCFPKSANDKRWVRLSPSGKSR
jgi:hypothetical protein